VPDVRGIEIGEDAEDALLFGVVHLVFGDLVAGSDDFNLGCRRGDVERDLGDIVGLAVLDAEIVGDPPRIAG